MPRVAVGLTDPTYNNQAPFHPDASFPELPFAETSSSSNSPYRLLRQLLHNLGYDRENFGTRRWNPLASVIKPGQTVVLNPNFVLSYHPDGGELFSIVTHPSILRAILDYVYIALQGEGRIIIADAPQMSCDWNELLAALRLDRIQQFYREQFQFDIELCDLRNFALISPRRSAYSTNRKQLAGDPLGSVVINLGRNSEFFGLPSENYYGADYDRTETIRHHHGEVHEYCVSKTILAADVYLPVPKMKVHKKVGVTLNLKGLVGINTNKNYLVHYRLGTPREGGDQLPDGQAGTTDRWLIKMQRWLYDRLRARQTPFTDHCYRVASSLYHWLIKPIRPVNPTTLIRDAGNWYGNDSAWRMTADLTKIIHFADSQGHLHDTPQRRIFAVVDGIVGGENDGPLKPDAKRAGCLVVGENPIAVDMVATRAMGFDVELLRQFDLVHRTDWDFGLRSQHEIEIGADGGGWRTERFFDPDCHDPLLGFRPHPGWVGHIEIGQRDQDSGHAEQCSRKLAG